MRRCIVSIKLQKPCKSDYARLKEYVGELESMQDANGTNGLYKAINEDTFEDWLRFIESGDRATFIVLDTDKLVGITNIRYVLNDYLRRGGGHIGYNIRPSERRKGYAEKTLKLALKNAYQNGLREVRVDCHKGNIASMKTIEACGGEFIKEEYNEDRKCILLKYKIDLKKVLGK